MAKNKYRKTVDASAASFHRRRGQAPGSSILVVTEGVNTEPIYFDELRRSLAASTVELVSYGKGAGDPKVLVDAALKLKAHRRGSGSVPAVPPRRVRRAERAVFRILAPAS